MSRRHTMFKKFRNQKGFTLVELIVVIVIIGILAAIAVPKFQDLSNSAKAAACKQNQAAIESAAAIYYANSAISGSAAYPSALSDLASTDYFKGGTVPTCPSLGSYTYASATGTITSCTVSGHTR